MLQYHSSNALRSKSSFPSVISVSFVGWLNWLFRAGFSCHAGGFYSAAQAACFINVNQCVCVWFLLCLIVGCPKRGCWSVKANISFTGIWFSFHLKINTPPSSSTRKHSAKASRRSSRQSLPSVPYFLANHDFFPAWTRCGGSSTTTLNCPSGNGSAVKSSCTSGRISIMAEILAVFKQVRFSAAIAE